VIANTALPAALVVFLLVGWIAGEVSFLAPYKRDLFHRYGTVIVTSVLIVFVNLHAAFYILARWLFLRDTGRKLTHLEGQLRTPDGLDQDLGRG
jgi:hypothetical protein